MPISEPLLLAFLERESELPNPPKKLPKMSPRSKSESNPENPPLNPPPNPPEPPKFWSVVPN